MEACEFVKQFGLFTSKEYLAGSTIYENHLMVFTNDCELNRLVKSHGLVDSLGGLHRSHEILDTWAFMLSVKAKVGKSADLLAEDYDNLKKAIEDVESCQ